MGLAASQGRFLLLTARQSDVEMQMQSITNQKLAMMRQQSALSAKHASAMNAQNVMWQPSEDQDPVELQYQNLMYQESPYILTNAYSAVMVDNSSTFAKQLCAALGIDPADYPNGMTGAEFVAKAGDEANFLKHFVTNTVGSVSKQNGGSTFNGVVSASDKIAALLRDKESVALSSTGKGTSLFETSYDDSVVKQIAFSENGVAGVYQVNTSISGNGKSGEGFGLRDITLIPLLFKDFDGDMSKYKTEDEARTYFNSNATNVSETVKNANSNIKAITSHMTEAVTTVLCGGSALGTDYVGYLKDFEPNIREACAWAEQATVNKFLYHVNDQNTYDSDSEVAGHKAGLVYDGGSNAYNDKNFNAYAASNNLDFVYNDESSESGNWWTGTQTTYAYNAHTQIDQEQVADTFLSYFDLYCEQNFSPNKIGDQETGNTVDTTNRALGTNGNIVTDNITFRGYTYYDEGYQQTLHVGGTSGTGHCTINGVAVGEGTGLDKTGAYWLKLYHQLATYGMQFNSNLSDSDYLQQQMLYGNVCVKSLQGYTSTSNVSINDDNSPMFLQEDEEAIEEETRRYEMESDAIAFKEALLDSMLQDLEAERDAITTEKDSVKKIIENNVKKFKIFC